jgi:tetratricopeptide (TPR) repeat protein
MKKAIIAFVSIVVLLFVMGTDLFVNPFTAWIEKNKEKTYAAKMQYFMGGYLYMVAQRQGRAVEIYRKAFQLFPGYHDEGEAHYRIGLYYEGQKDYPKATTEYQLILEKWPNMGEKLGLNQRIARFKAYSGEAGNP